MLQALFFVLTCVALAALYALLHDVPRAGIVTGLAALVLAEYLIGVRRWFGTGVEAALWLGGLFALISELPRSGTPESALVLASAAAIAGWRVRNPFFGLLAGAIVVYYMEERLDGGVVAALVLGVLAMLNLLRTWRRPSAERLWAAMAIALPLVGRLAADPLWVALTITLYFGYGLLALVLALRRWHHALFFASGVGFAVAAIDLSGRISAPGEVKLALAGVLLLAGSWWTSHALRDRATGLVAQESRLSPLGDALEAAGALAAAHAHPAESPDEQGPEGGGSFGGAGATGTF